MHAPYPLPQEAVQACALPPPPTGVCSHMHTAPLNEGRHLHMCPPRLGKEGCSGMSRTTTSGKEVVGACALPHLAQEVVQASAWHPVSM